MDWDRYSYDDFVFQIIELVDNKKDLKTREQFWIDETDAINDHVGYNVSPYTSYKYMSVPADLLKNCYYCDDINETTKQKLRKNITIFYDDKLNREGDNKNALSKTWFSKHSKEVEQLRKHTYNYFKNRTNSKSKEVAWTTFVFTQRKVASKGSIKSFVPLNGKLHKHNRRNILAFIANCYVNSFQKRKLQKQEYDIDGDKYSLSILLKWIVNVSDINKPITIYIPSSRMRELLEHWMGDR